MEIIFAPTFPTFGEAVDAAAQVAEHKQAVGLASSRAVMSKRWWRQAADAVVLVDLPKGEPVGARGGRITPSRSLLMERLGRR